MKNNRLLHRFLFTCALCLMAPLSSWGETGNYYGTATITAPANLGTIDLAFTLDVSGTAIQHDTSYIMLDKTLLFPAVPEKVGGKDVGPRVTGTASPTSFSLITDDFTSLVSGKTVTRKVTLTGTSITNNGAAITGTYTETMTNMTPEVIIVTGTFILVMPTVQTIVVALKDQNGDGCLSLNEIRSAGANTNAIEYNDISQALHLYYNPSLTPNICAPKEQIIKDAFGEFYATQKQ